MDFFLQLDKWFRDIMNWLGQFLPQLALRLLLAYEFWEAGLMKLQGENWFNDLIQANKFPFPFNVLPAEISWNIALGAELLGAAALAIGLGTRYWALVLIILDVVAWSSVHASNGYNVCDNGFKLALMYLVMLLPLLMLGAGKLSVDYWILQRSTRRYFL